MAAALVALVLAPTSSPGRVHYELTIAPTSTKQDSGISTVDLASGAHQQLEGFRNAAQHRWSEDGKRVVYRAGTAIWIAKADGTGALSLISDKQLREQKLGYSADQPDWSADERTILFRCLESDKAALCSVPARGGRARRVVVNTHPGGAEFEDFDVSRRNGEIVATRFTGGATLDADLRWDIVTMHADGSGFRALTKRVRAIRGDAVWSPDGTRIAFREERLLRMMNANGSGKHLVHDFGRYARSPYLLSWSPAGDLIAFGSGPGIWVIDPAGDDLRPITTTWRPGGLDWRRR